MTFTFKPEKFLKYALPVGFFKKSILNRKNDLKAQEVRAIITATTLSKRELKATTNKVIDFYEKKMQDLKKSGDRSFRKDALNGEKLLKNRIENLVLFNEVQNIKKDYKGSYYRWLPSSSENPDPEHQLLYGKIFKVGEGDADGNMPSERYGCKCGMEILTEKEAKGK